MLFRNNNMLLSELILFPLVVKEEDIIQIKKSKNCTDSRIYDYHTNYLLTR